MSEDSNLPQAGSLEVAIIERQRLDQASDPNRRFRDVLTLHNSSRMGVIVSHSEIVDQHTGEIHHDTVKIEQIKKLPKSKGGGWPIILSSPATIWLSNENSNEIRLLRDFLGGVISGIPEDEGSYLVVKVDDDLDHWKRLVEMASPEGKAHAIVNALEAVQGDHQALEHLSRLYSENPQTANIATVALNLGRYQSALEKLKELVANGVLEREFQTLLEENYWLFGTEYHELLALRRATRDQQQDFIVRRTIDDYIEIIEIKTPLNGSSLFVYDKSHQCYYPSAELSKVIGQVMNYINQLELERPVLFSRDGLDSNKIRARIVIGRDGSADHAVALRNLNGHLHRIEIITFDQLVKIGQRAVEHLQALLISDEQATEADSISDDVSN